MFDKNVRYKMSFCDKKIIFYSDVLSNVQAEDILNELMEEGLISFHTEFIILPLSKHSVISGISNIA